MNISKITLIATAGASLALAGCLSVPVKTGDESAKTTATGSAAGATSANANSTLEHCDRPAGTIAVVEDQSADWFRYISGQYRLTSTVPVLRLLIQQSNCFIVVERGRAMANMQQERALQQSGELRAGSNFGKGQMVSADYTVNPEVLISERDTGGVGGALGGISRSAGVVGAVLGSVKQNEAATLLTLVDNRSGVQVAAAEGSAKNFDWGLGGALFGGSAGAGLGGYTRTPQGKVIAGAFTDAYNQLVVALRNYSPQTMGDRGLGTGGRLAVDGAAQPVPASAAAGLTVKEAQQKLNALGYDVGVADGVAGAKTTNALRRFQSERGIQVTGRLDPTTKAELAK